MINLAFSINIYHFIKITISTLEEQELVVCFHSSSFRFFTNFAISGPTTRSLQLPHIPVKAFSPSDRFLVWIYLEFRSPQELQWPIAVARFNRITEGGRVFAVTTCQLWNSLSLECRNSVSLESFKNNHRNIFDVQQKLHHFVV